MKSILKSLDRAKVTRFAVVFAILFGVSLVPIPWLADTYVTGVSLANNALLSVVGGSWPVAASLDPPARIERQGSWKGNLRLENRRTTQAIVAHLNLWSLSYRPMVTFVALAVASLFIVSRRRLVLWSVGLVVMFVVTTCFSALPVLSRFAAAGALGEVPGLVVRTIYQATATPVMVYAIPVLVWWLLIKATQSATAAGADDPKENATEHAARAGSATG